MSANLVLTTMDDSAKRVWDVSSERLEAVVGHKFGPDAAHNTHLATETARNVVLVYVDMRGFARRALFKKAGKEFVKARVGGPAKSSGDSSSAAQASCASSPAPAPAPASASAVPPSENNVSTSSSSRPATPSSPTAVSPVPYAEYKRGRSGSRDPKRWEGVTVSYAIRGEPLTGKV